MILKQIVFNWKISWMWVFEMTFWSSAAIFTKLYYLHIHGMVLTTLSHLWAPYIQLQNHLLYKQKRWLRESMMLFEDRVFKQGVFKLKISPNVSFLACFFGLPQPSFPWKGVKLTFYISNLNQNHQNFTNLRLRQALFKHVKCVKDGWKLVICSYFVS